MKHNHRSERGQAIVLITLAIVGLVAMTGLAIDGGFAFSDRRHAQNAADSGALSGALTRIHPDSASALTPEEQAVLAAKNIAVLNGFDDLATSEVFVNIPPKEPGPYYDNFNYVEVVIESYRETYFAKVIGVDKMYNRVTAVARAKLVTDTPLYGGGQSIVSLKPTSKCGPGDFIIGGNTNVILDGGGIFVNSNAECALKCNGAAGILASPTDDPPVPISIVGGYTQEKCGENYDASYTTGVPPFAWPDDVIILDPPSECSDGPLNPSPHDNGDGTYTLDPGKYTEFPPKKIDKIVLKKGNYCIDTSLKVTNGDTSITGSDVFLYFTSGNSFSFEGGDINLSARIPPEVYDPSDPYAGFLFYLAPSSPIPTPLSKPSACKINGNGTSNYTGTIYAPTCDITVNGSSGTEGMNLQIIGYSVTLEGTSGLKLNYDGDLFGVLVDPAELGIAQ